MSVNQVFINGEEILSTRGNTVTENTLVQGETAQDKTGKTIKGELDPVTEEELDEVKEQLNELSDDVYKVSDEEGEIEETDYIPFNDISDVEKPKKKALLSSIIDKIKSAFLSKTWGHIELIQSSDVLTIKDKEVDATESDNGVTAIHYPSSNSIVDNESRILSRYEAVVKPSGDIYAKMYARNYDANGNTVGSNSIEAGVDKSGNNFYYVTDPDKFRKAINTIDQMGTKIPANSDLDDYTTAGTYYVENNSDAGTISNMPFGVAYSGKLIVLDMDSNVRVDQIYITNYNGTGDLVHIYARQISNEGVAKPWREVTAPHTYDIGTEIPSNADLNNYTTAGVYYVLNATVASTISNIPSADAGKLIVLDRDTGTRLFQVYVISRSYIYIRDMDNNSVWDEWLKLATINDITPANVGNGYAEATVSGSAITATITGFKLRAGVIVAIRIVPEITSACTLNINNTGAKSVKFWSNEDVSFGKPIGGARITTFIYDGTYYRVISIDRTPHVGNQSYVADTSGNILIDWGYGSNRAQLKYNVGSNKLLWNYYKNSAWRGDVVLADYDDLITWGQKDIPTGSDLNDYNTIGVYSIKTGTIAQNTDNIPIELSGKLIVVALTSTSSSQSWKAQFYIPNHEEHFYQRVKTDNDGWRPWVEYANTNQIIKTGSNLENIASLDDIPVNTVGKIEFTSASGLSPLESSSIRAFFYTCFTPTSDCKVLTLTRYNPTFTNSSSKWERVNNGSGWTPYWVDYTPRGTYVGTCTTAGATKDKVATVEDSFKLTKGVRVAIKFSNNNTYSNVTSSPITLNVNGTGAKNIWYNTTHSGAGNTGTNTTAYGVASRYVYYVYDGTYWVWDGCGVDNNTTYSAMSVSELTTGTATSQRTVRADYLKTGIETLITNKTDTSLNTSSSNPIANSVVASSFQTLTNKVKEHWSEGGKNLLPYPYYDTNGTTSQGFTFVVNDDGSIYLNGSYGSGTRPSFNLARPMLLKAGTYVISKGSTSLGALIRVIDSVNTSTVYGSANDTTSYNEFTLSQDTNVFVQVLVNNNSSVDFTIYPMLCYASDFALDDTYEPCAKTNRQLTSDSVTWDDLSEVGAVNMLPNNGTSQTVNEVTFTVNPDKSITAVVASTPSSARYFDIYNFDASYPHIGETLKLSGCPKNGGSDTYALLVNNASVGIGASDYGNGKIFLFDNDGTTTPAKARIKIGTSCPAGTYVFKPMITVPSYNGDYVPYAKSNKELTGNVQYNPGDSITYQTNSLFSGFIGNGSKVFFTIPVRKAKTNVTSASLQLTSITFRGVQGYLENGTSNVVSDYTVALNKMYDSHVEFEIYRNDAADFTNFVSHSPVSITLGGTLTFE